MVHVISYMLHFLPVAEFTVLFDIGVMVHCVLYALGIHNSGRWAGKGDSNQLRLEISLRFICPTGTQDHRLQHAV